MITADLYARLRAALPTEVQVLTPEQQREPYEAAPTDAQGRPMVGGGERGLGAYLRAHPQGYVQVEAPQGITDDGVLAVYWVAVAAVATSPQDALSLALTVRRALCGTPQAPGAYASRLPDLPRALADGAYLVRPTYEITAIDGQLAV